jgi:hypothetical protein
VDWYVFGCRLCLTLSLIRFPCFAGGALVVFGANVCLVIILIAAEILVAAINIVVDLYAGVE